MGKYDAIIGLPHHVSKKHPPMPMEKRAAQFAPFAALTGHAAAIRETARLTDQKIELDDAMKLEISDRLRELADRLPDAPPVAITYFLPDAYKSGGSYVDAVGTVRKLDAYARMIVMQDGRKIPIDDVLEVTWKTESE